MYISTPVQPIICRGIRNFQMNCFLTDINKRIFVSPRLANREILGFVSEKTFSLKKTKIKSLAPVRFTQKQKPIPPGVVSVDFIKNLIKHNPYNFIPVQSLVFYFNHSAIVLSFG
jgi:hypothetical protein